MRLLFLAAYTGSGLAGLIYQVAWARQLTLIVGHTTAAASTVVAAFLGGLAAGAAMGGRAAPHVSPRVALRVYAALECVVIVCALAMPYELAALTPWLRDAYASGLDGWAFPIARSVSSFAIVFVPACALGATYPMAMRAFADTADRPARASGLLYALNTVGATVGSLLAGFTLLPAVGATSTVRVAMGVSLAAAAGALAASMSTARAFALAERPVPVETRGRKKPGPAPSTERLHVVAVAAVLAMSGFAALVHEITWTRVLALTLGPTTYAFSAAIAAVIAGVAIGSGAGTWLLGRTARPATSLAATLALAGLVTAVTGWLAGGPVQSFVAAKVAASPESFDVLLRQGALLSVAFVLPTAALLGAAFPLTLGLIDDTSASSRGFSVMYAVNTLGSVGGSLAAGFLLIPALGLQTTLRAAAALMAAGAAIVAWRGVTGENARTAAYTLAAGAIAIVGLTPGWDRALLAGGGYLYAPFVPRGLDVEAMLKAGELLYYREGASATVSVKRLTGTTTLAVDGKTDASSGGDLLTQKLLAHLPLLLHERPRHVAVVGLGSGATAGAALAHEIDSVDVIEISREVVEASSFFAAENNNALADRRTRLLVGDGRSHLVLTDRSYDVIVSEPSNPWIAGVAALFTREFFEAARSRLAAGGIMCQWANAYNISDADLRSIAATFRAVFPQGTMWLVGESDLLLIGSADALAPRLTRLALAPASERVRADLATVGANDVLSLLSLYAAGPDELASYAADAPVLDDDRMALEFSAPRALRRHAEDEDNVGPILRLLPGDAVPDAVRAARQRAGAREWRNLARMLAGAGAHARAYDALTRALQVDPTHRETLEELARLAVLLGRGPDALSWIRTASAGREDSPDVLVARSRLLASIGERSDAVKAAEAAVRLAPARVDVAAHLADVHTQAGDADALDAAVAHLRALAPASAETCYFEAAAAMLRDRFDEARASAQRAIAANAAYAASYDLLGASLMRLGDGAGAGRAFRQSIERNPRDGTAYANLGALQLAAGNAEAAANYFAQALWLAPDDPIARRGLADALSRR